ncbi:MAG: hypothetical protein IJN48_00240, partial [Clostridia bacterium]|nr:hypothetical protein [Clostridia bacterium]
PGIVEWRLDGEIASKAVVLPKIYEAENGTALGLTLKRFKISDPLSSANGFVHQVDDAESGVKMDIYVAKAGLYDVEITYSGDGNAYPNSSNKILVNDEYVMTVKYEKLSGWVNWEKQTVRLALGEGASTITFMYNDDLEESFARLDCIKLTYAEVPEGDIDGDGKVMLNDALLLLKAILNESDCNGDMNADGKINLLDSLLLFKKIVK